ncbi:hypothetical protein [Rhizobium sp. SGZ-381]|uniref:hypothetical protein n=1 Tax=Rhizobium sp. SGZ-381 TaxID=3342800 RepID=UPI003670D53F
MTRSRPPFALVPLTYEQQLEIFERGLASLVAKVSSFTSEGDLTGDHRETFNGLFNIAHAHLFWSKEKIVEAFRPLDTVHIRCLDCCPGVYRRTGAWAVQFGAEEAFLDLRLMTRSDAADWIVTYGEKTGYTPGQIEIAKLERKRLRVAA